MRIIIETEEQKRVQVTRTEPEGAGTRTEAIDAGGPSESLLQEVGSAATGTSYTTEAAKGYATSAPSKPDAIDAGSPPDWLRSAIEQAAAAAPASSNVFLVRRTAHVTDA
jgi:hypothetical protein